MQDIDIDYDMETTHLSFTTCLGYVTKTTVPGGVQAITHFNEDGNAKAYTRPKR